MRDLLVAAGACPEFGLLHLRVATDLSKTKWSVPSDISCKSSFPSTASLVSAGTGFFSASRRQWTATYAARKLETLRHIISWTARCSLATDLLLLKHYHYEFNIIYLVKIVRILINYLMRSGEPSRICPCGTWQDMLLVNSSTRGEPPDSRILFARAKDVSNHTSWVAVV